MIEVIFKKNSGSYQKGRVAAFTPALADFFVSKLGVAEYYKALRSDPPTFNEFELPEGDDLLAIASDDHTTAPKRRGRPKRTEYLTRDMKAAE